MRQYLGSRGADRRKLWYEWMVDHGDRRHNRVESFGDRLIRWLFHHGGAEDDDIRKVTRPGSSTVRVALRQRSF